MKDKTLSDKINNAWEGYKGNIDTEDVKDFIQKLKKELCERQVLKVWKEEIAELINELAGAALIHNQKDSVVRSITGIECTRRPDAGSNPAPSGTHSPLNESIGETPSEDTPEVAHQENNASGTHSQQENSAKSSIRFIHPAGTSKRKTLALGWEGGPLEGCANCGNSEEMHKRATKIVGSPLCETGFITHNQGCARCGHKKSSHHISGWRKMSYGKARYFYECLINNCPCKKFITPKTDNANKGCGNVIDLGTDSYVCQHGYLCPKCRGSDNQNCTNCDCQLCIDDRTKMSKDYLKRNTKQSEGGNQNERI